MIKTKFAIFTLGLLFGVTHFSEGAAVVVVTVDTGLKQLADAAGVPLSAGTSANGDGVAIQLGYYVGASAGQLFGPAAAQFVSLLGANSIYGLNLTIGDDGPGNGAGAGEIFSSEFNLQNPPASLLVGTPLVLRFFSATTVGNSQTFEALANSNGAWNWKAPAEPPSTLAINLNSAGLVAQSGSSVSGNILRASSSNPEAIPEPSSLLLFSIGALVSLKRRRA